MHISSSDCLIIFTVFAVTVSSYPSTYAILISGKTSLVKESLMLGKKLPQSVIDATSVNLTEVASMTLCSVNSFKNRLDEHWRTPRYGQ